MSSPLSSPTRAQLEESVEPIRTALDGRSSALAQEWIGSRAGSEKVFEALAVLLPDARLFTLTHTPGVEIETGGRPITTSFLDRAVVRDRRSLTLPLMPAAWRSIREPFDVVLTSAHALARTFGRDARTHLSYVHSPARYVWFPDVDTRSRPTGKVLQAPARALLKRIDRSATIRTDALAANSLTTRDRIREVFDRDAVVIHPPVDTNFYSVGEGAPRSGLLALGRLIPYKRMDTAIELAHRLGEPLTLVGNGPELDPLRRFAEQLDADVTFLTDASDEDVRALYRGSAALIFPGNEDFGIVPVEAQACGCPVVTAGIGGALETVVGGVTGVHAASGDLDDLVAATAELLDGPTNPAACRSQAERFSYGAFGASIADWVRRTLTGAPDG